MKMCNRCGIPQLKTQFGRNRQSADGLHYYCKACARVKRREWAERNGEKLKSYRDTYRNKIRAINDKRDPYAD
jgi:late competence protein required for DNA uptake (superfamily II DNA/RNA helicase)